MLIWYLFFYSCQVHLKIKCQFQLKTAKKLQKVAFTNEFFVNKKSFLSSVKHINVTRNIIKTLSKYILNICEAHIHFGGTFLKPTLQIFFKTFEDGHFGKNDIFKYLLKNLKYGFKKSISKMNVSCTDVQNVFR